MTRADPRTTDSRLRFAMPLVAVAVFAHATTTFATNVETESLALDHGITTLSVESPRPLETAVLALVSRDGAIITYEDPRYEFKGDLQDVTHEVSKGWYRYLPGAPKIIVPAGGKLTLGVPSTDIAVILNQLVQLQSASSNGGRFRLEQDADAFHVVPAAVRDRDGNWTVRPSVLDVSISLPTRERAEQEMVDAICAAVGAAAHVKVRNVSNLLSVLVGPEGRPQYLLGSERESARSVLTRALATIAVDRGRMTWILLYDPSPTDPAYYFSLIAVPDKSVHVPATVGPAQPTQTAKVVTTDTTEDKPSQPSLACTTDAECPSGQRCGFRGDKFSECIVLSNTTHCIDPGGRCGCDGRNVEIFCAVGSNAEYTSAPACFVGGCPMICNENMRCPSSLTCQNGLCGKP